MSSTNFTWSILKYFVPNYLKKDHKNLANIIPFHASGLFIYPLKTSGNQRFADIFREYRKVPVAQNRLIEKGGDHAEIFYEPLLRNVVKWSDTLCSKLTIKTPERRYWCRPCVFIAYFEHLTISHLVLLFLFLTLSM